MRNRELDLLSPEERNEEMKKRSHRRLFTVFIFVNIGLALYIAYSFILLFTNLIK